MNVVVGLDLSMASTGIATPSGVRAIKSSGHEGASLRVRRARLADIVARVSLAVAEDSISRGRGHALVVIEGPSYNSKGGKNHERAGLWWLVVDELLSAGHVVAEVPPPTLKKYALGVGVGDKGAMADAAARRIPDVQTRGQNDVVDALWLRAMGCDHLGQPLAAVPQAHRAALDKVAWPDTARSTA